jgi:GTP cyclohydrolase I
MTHAAAQDLDRWRIEHHSRVDPRAAEQAAADLLLALGLDLDDESMADTPGRMARAYAELLTPDPFEMTTFPNDEGYDELVLVRDIPVRSLCEHHMLPFVGVAHVSYLPGDRILGLSKLARLVDHHARGAQTQERLTQRVGEHLAEALGAAGVGVVVEAEHLCMTLRGVRVPGSRTVTSTLLGRLREDPASRAEFLALTRGAPTGRLIS